MAPVIQAYMSGAAAGGVLTAAPFCAVSLLYGQPMHAFALLLMLGPLLSVIWAIGLLWLGTPAWLLLHGLGLRKPSHAAVLGFALPSAATLAATAFSVPQLAPIALLAGLVGVAVGLIVHRTAYGRSENPRNAQTTAASALPQ